MALGGLGEEGRTRRRLQEQHTRRQAVLLLRLFTATVDSELGTATNLDPKVLVDVAMATVDFARHDRTQQQSGEAARIATVVDAVLQIVLDPTEAWDAPSATQAGGSAAGPAAGDGRGGVLALAPATNITGTFFKDKTELIALARHLASGDVASMMKMMAPVDEKVAKVLRMLQQVLSTLKINHRPNMAGMITTDPQTELSGTPEELFDRFDQDKSGNISFAEFEQALRTFNQVSVARRGAALAHEFLCTPSSTHFKMMYEGVRFCDRAMRLACRPRSYRPNMVCARY